MTDPSPGNPPLALPARPITGRLALPMPAGATDCHCHVFLEPKRYPWVDSRSYTPAPASLDDYRAMCAAVGLQRTVQVNASVYGYDNRVTLDTIAALGIDHARGVAGIPADIGTAELERLHAGGMRGARLSTHVAGYGGTDHLEAMARAVRPVGWHLQIHLLHGDELAALEHRLLRLEAPLVFDHLGCVAGRDGVDSPGFQALLRILTQRDDCWVKLSSWYRRSDQPAPHDDIRPLAQALVSARPDRVVFGSNWPHAAIFDEARMPDDVALVSTLFDWVPDPDRRDAILVHNPARLYGFATP